MPFLLPKKLSQTTEDIELYIINAARELINLSMKANLHLLYYITQSVDLWYIGPMIITLHCHH